MGKIHNSANHTYVNALNDIISALTSDLLLEDILRLIVLVAANVTRVNICSLWIVEEKNGSKILRLTATQAINPDYVKDRVLSMGEGIVGHVASEKKIMAIDDVLKDPRFKEKEMAEKLSLVSMLSVPMLTDDNDDNKVIGVLNGFTCVAHHFSETEINLFKSVANKASIAIENAGRIVQAIVIERELEILKKIDHAQRILMERKNLSRDMAFNWIQKRSIDTCESMKEIAEAILLTDELW